MTPMKTLRDLAEIAYAAYGVATDYKNFRGDLMPAFADLPATIQSAWEDACDAVRDAIWEEDIRS